MKTVFALERFVTNVLGRALLLGYFACSVTASAADAPRPLAPSTALSLQEARVIIDAAVAYARDQKMTMTVVILDEEGQLIAKGKAYASLILRYRTETAAELAKTRPDRYFGIMNMYPGEVYLVGGGLPLSVNNRLVGAVGVAGLPQGVDEKAAEAGISAWTKFRASMKK